MFDFGWSELALIGVVAVIFLGPKELPAVLRTLGQWNRKLRALAREFQGGLDDMVRDADLSEVKEQIRGLQTIDVKAKVAERLDPGGEIRGALEQPRLPPEAPRE